MQNNNLSYNSYLRDRNSYNEYENDRYNPTSLARARKPVPVHEQQFKSKKAPDIVMKKSPPKRGSVIKIVFIALSAFGLLFTLLYGNVQTNKMYREVAEKNSILDEAKSENIRLKSELEGKMTLKNVEDYVQRVLKLQKLDNSQIKYVQTQTDDAVEIVDEESGLLDTIKEKFNGFVEYIFG